MKRRRLLVCNAASPVRKHLWFLDRIDANWTKMPGCYKRGGTRRGPIWYTSSNGRQPSYTVLIWSRRDPCCIAVMRHRLWGILPSWRPWSRFHSRLTCRGICHSRRSLCRISEATSPKILSLLTLNYPNLPLLNYQNVAINDIFFQSLSRVFRKKFTRHLPTTFWSLNYYWAVMKLPLIHAFWICWPQCSIMLLWHCRLTISFVKPHHWECHGVLLYQD